MEGDVTLHGRPDRFELTMVPLHCTPSDLGTPLLPVTRFVDIHRPSSHQQDDNNKTTSPSHAAIRVRLDNLDRHGEYELVVRGVGTGQDRTRHATNDLMVPLHSEVCRLQVALVPKISLTQGAVQENAVVLNFGFAGWVVPALLHSSTAPDSSSPPPARHLGFACIQPQNHIVMVGGLR